MSVPKEYAVTTASTTDEATPLLSGQIKSTQNGPQQGPHTRAKLVIVVVLMLCTSAGTSNDSLLSQYFMDRFSEEAGISNNTEVHPCADNSSDPDVQMINEIQAKTSHEMLYLTLCQTIPACIACLFVGSFSDNMGRRPFLVLPLATMNIKMACVLVTVWMGLPLWVLRGAFILDGLVGSWFALLIIVYSISADVTTGSQSRSLTNYFLSTTASVVQAATYFGSGYMISHLGYIWASIALCSMIFLSFIIALTLMPETLQNRPPHSQLTLNPLSHIRRIFGFYFFDGSLRSRFTFSVVLAIFWFGVIADLGVGSIDALYQIHEPFCWQATQIGAFKAIRSFVCYGLGLPILKVLQQCLPDEKIAMVSILFQATAYLFEAFIRSSWEFYLVPFILTTSTLCIPIVRTIMSLLAGVENYGAIYSSVAVIETLCNAVAGALFNEVYAATVSTWPGAVYVVIACCSMITFILFIVYFCMRIEGRETTTIVESDSTPYNIQESSEHIQNSSHSGDIVS